MELLSKEHTILERPFMEFRPFGMDERGEKIRDISGVVIRANVDYLEEYVARTRGPSAGERAVQDLCRLLNERIRNPAYHVTPAFLKNVWNSYAYEFLCFLREFAEPLSGDPDFHFNVGKEKHVSPLIQILGRPFPLPQIYKMYPHFSQKYAKGSIQVEAGPVTDRSAVLRLKFTPRSYLQFGPYRRACAEMTCQSAKGALMVVPERVHHLQPAAVKDHQCIVNDDEWCEWEFTWSSPSRKRWAWPTLTWASGGMRSLSGDAGMMAKTYGCAPPAESPAEPVQESGEGCTATAGAQAALLSKEHTILEREFMEFRPFGVDERGEKIRDISGVVVRSNVEYLEEYMTRKAGPEAAKHAVQDLCRLLNGRIRDPAYHVSPDFLRNTWNSYSYEFVSFVRELGKVLSGDPHFQFNLGKERNIPPLLQILGRPFTLPQIYKMWPYFGQKYAKGVLEFEVGTVTECSAVLRIRFTERAHRQFGSYRKACAQLVCDICKGGLSSVPERVHRLRPATVKDCACIVNGDEYCEWEFTWIPESSNRRVWLVGGGLAAAAAFAYVRLVHPAVTVVEAALITFLPSAISWVAFAWLLRKITSLQTLIMEQDQAVDARHEELREVYLEQERTTVELRRRVNQLTTLHRTGLLFSSTLERETLLHNVLETLVHDLQYNRAMIAFYDGARGVLSDMRILGVSDEIADLTRSRELSITNPDSLEGMVLLQGKPVLVSDLQEAWDRMHPLTRQLAVMANVKSMISVPLKINDLILGCMTVDCVHEHALSQEDLDLMMTMATQVAVALDKTEAYRQIETLNLGLETRVRERTAELEAANNQLQQMDRLKSQFLAHVSHELRTPLTSITGFTDNMLEGLAGSLSEKQQQYLTRIKANGSRLARMITNLLDLSRIEAGKLELSLEDIPLAPLISEVVEQIRPIALAKHQRLQLQCEDSDVTAWGDADRLSQILTNLVDNAIKYTQDGGSVMVNVARETASYAKISVTDNGQGIPREALPKLFDPFFRASHHERSQKGLGLGLSIVKELVELHGGAITVRSDEGKGTQFCFTIPLRRGMGKRIPEASQPAKRILVGDDDADIRHLLRDRLESEGYLVHLALDGREALGALRSGSLDGMILDIGIPQIDGLDVLRQVRKKYPAMPVIMITAVEARERAIAAMQAGANAYLLKPFTSAQLQHVVDRYFRPEFERMEGVE